MFLINYVTYQKTNTTQNTHTTKKKTSPGEGLQSLIALFLVVVIVLVVVHLL